MLYVACPLLDEVGRHRVDGQSEEVLNLCGEDGYGDTAREAYNNRVGNVLDDSTKLEQTEQNEEHASHDGGDGESFDAVLLYDAVDDDDESTGRTANLHLATAEQRHKETGYDGSDDAFLGCYARGDAECDGERQCHNAYNDARHEVGHKVLFVV